MTHPLTPTQQETRVMTEDEYRFRSIVATFAIRDATVALINAPTRQLMELAQQRVEEAIAASEALQEQARPLLDAADAAWEKAAAEVRALGTPIRWYHRLWWRVKRWLP